MKEEKSQLTNHLLEIRILFDRNLHKNSPYESFCLFNELLRLLSGKEPIINCFGPGVDNLQKNMDVLKICSDFYHSYEFSYSVCQLSRFLFEYDSRYEVDHIRIKKFCEVIDYLSVVNNVEYKRWAPILLYYLGGSVEAFRFLEKLDNEEQDNDMNSRMQYYLLRSTFDCGDKNEISGIKNAAVKYIELKTDPSEEDLYYRELIQSYNPALFKNRNIEIVKNTGSKESLFSNLNEGVLNEIGMVSFLRKSEMALLEKEKTILLTRIWDYFDISEKEQEKIHFVLLASRIDDVVFRKMQMVDRNILLEELQSKFPEFNNPQILKIWENRLDIEKAIVDEILCKPQHGSDNKIEICVQLFMYFYLTNDCLSAVDLVCLATYATMLFERNIINSEKFLVPKGVRSFIPLLSLLCSDADVYVKIANSILSIGLFIKEVLDQHVKDKMIGYSAYCQIKQDIIRNLDSLNKKYGSDVVVDAKLDGFLNSNTAITHVEKSK